MDEEFSGERDVQPEPGWMVTATLKPSPEVGSKKSRLAYLRGHHQHAPALWQHNRKRTRSA
jgi:hypothetical protein